jgi:hydroxyacylglutathione hydrolase
MTADVTVIPALGDNLIYLHRGSDGSVLAVDPSDASAVLTMLDRYELSLTAILATHHHWDHVAGIAKLKSRTGCEVIAGDKSQVPSIDRVVTDGDMLTFGRTNVQVIAAPGHTRTGVCYHAISSPDHPGVVYTGDTLFIGGCGRLLECDARTMWQSLQRLAALPEQTWVYCGHEYTLENYEFALSIEPGNETVARRIAELRQAVAGGLPTVPSTIAQEKATNIFLRATDPAVKAALGMPDADPVQVFTALRRRKDRF